MPEAKPSNNFRHGGAIGGRVTPEHTAWCHIRYACRQAAQSAEPGASVPSVFPEWDQSFSVFLAAVGPRPSPRHMLVRLDPLEDWAPGNVVWSLKRGPRVRGRSDLRHIEINGRRIAVQGKASTTSASRRGAQS